MRRLARPTKHRETNTDDLITQLIEAVTDIYLHPPENTEDENGRMYLNLLAEEFSMTPIKVRKLLISSSVYQIDITALINNTTYSRVSKKYRRAAMFLHISTRVSHPGSTPGVLKKITL